ncbi:MAG TPA: tannase/feruloyl esterase family alpha/beta hydrolase [Steroidobacteraceae bacterium]
MKKLSACGLLLIITAPAASAHAADCASLAKFTLPGHQVVISKVQQVPAGATPAHCRVDGVIDQRVGSDGKPYGIGFAVALPEKWNGRFLFQGGGGLNGSVAPPLGGAYAGGHAALERGFAVASTDSGHQSTGFDPSFFADQQAALNFLYQAVPEATLVAKALVARRYGKAAEHAYFVGCSTGGREAMMMSQRFPDYFDGIVAAAPAMRTSFSNLGLRHAATALNAIAPRTPDGKPRTRDALSDADRALVLDGLLKACDGLDGNEDGLLFAPHRCAFDPGTLECAGEKTARCLSRGQVRAIRAVMAGPRTTSGRQVYPGYYYDTGIVNTQGLAGVLAAPFIPEGPAADTSMDVDAAAADAMSARAMVGDTNAWTNLSSFRGHGGKLILLHGVSDPWFSAQDTVQYYERLAADNAEVPLPEWSRMFLVPGMGHCGGGARTLDQFDMLSAVVDWVEKQQAPESVVATGSSAPGESRPLCAYPAYAHYSGSGDARQATSYSCRKP